MKGLEKSGQADGEGEYADAIADQVTNWVEYDSISFVSKKHLKDALKLTKLLFNFVSGASFG